MQRAASVTWSVVGIALLLFVLMNLAAWPIARLDSVTKDDISLALRALDTPDESTAKSLVEEQVFLAGRDDLSGQLRWEPHSYWRMRATTGLCVNVDADGLRRTAAQKAAAFDAPRIYCFGGSTMWGILVRDEHTIPSCLSKLLEEAGVSARVVNYGQVGYVSSQQVAAFVRCCVGGDAPDLAVFYSGVNDIAAVIQNGVVGTSMNEGNRIEEFNLLKGTARLPLLKALTRSLPLVRAFGTDAFDISQYREQAWNERFDALMLDYEFRRLVDQSLAARPLGR